MDRYTLAGWFQAPRLTGKVSPRTKSILCLHRLGIEYVDLCALRLSRIPAVNMLRVSRYSTFCIILDEMERIFFFFYQNGAFAASYLEEYMIVSCVPNQ